MHARYHLRGDNVTQSPQDIKGPGPLSEKRRKCGGELTTLDVDDSEWPRNDCRPRHDLRPHAAKAEKGPFLDEKRFYVDHRPPLTPKPISKAAIRLLSEYLRRRGFEEAIQDGSPIEFAGKAFFGVNRTRAYEIRDSMPHGALAWFEEEFVFGLASGKISEGRATVRSHLADHFFIELAGGIHVWRSLRLTAGGQRRIVAKELLTDAEIGLKEATFYGIHSRAFFNAEDN